MKGIYFLVFFAGLAVAAIQPTGPVYRSAAAQGKQQNHQPLPVASPQPAAEERESTSFQTAETVAKPSVSVGANPTAPTTGAVPNTYTVVYYPQTTHPPQTQYSAQVAQGQSQYPNTVTSQVYQQQPQQPAVDAWTRYHINDILVGGAALGLVFAGSAFLYPKLVHVRSRALRELSELKADDASRMVKGVMRALEKYYEMNSKVE